MLEDQINESGSSVFGIDRRGSLKAIAGAFSLIAGGSLSVGSVSANDESEPEVSVKEATKVAQQIVRKASQRELYEEFAGGKVRSPELYYSLTDDDMDAEMVPSVYVFPVVNGKNHVGHVTTGARQDMPTIVEYGSDPAPHLKAEESLSQAEKSLSSGGEYLFQGPMTFGISATDKTNGEEYFVDIESGLAYDLDAAPKINPSEGVDHTESWDARTEQDEFDSSDVELLSSGSISGVPNWTDTGYSSWPGCTPIAGAMCLGYHESFPNRPDIIDGLNDEMNTFPDGTTLPDFMDDGIEGYDSSYSASNNYNGRPSAAKGGVNNNNPPFVNTMGDKEDGQIDTESDDVSSMWDISVGHSETIVGYEEEGSWTGTDLYLDTHNTWGGTRTVLVGDYWDAYMITTIEP